jgi:hypothetical protein
MYWKNQENIIFDIVLFVVIVFQVATVYVVKTDSNISQYLIIIICLNLLFFALMVLYAKWVWKMISYQKALLKVIKHEFIILAVCLMIIIIVSFLHERVIKDS